MPTGSKVYGVRLDINTAEQAMAKHGVKSFTELVLLLLTKIDEKEDKIDLRAFEDKQYRLERKLKVVEAERDALAKWKKSVEESWG